jgi:preprotein translocase subunit SecA
LSPSSKRRKITPSTKKPAAATLTEEGVAHAERLLQVDRTSTIPRNIELLHHTNQALKAHTLFKRDVDYIVKDGEVIIVDEFTGRLMPGGDTAKGFIRRWKPRKTSKSRMRTRPWPPSRFRIISACTTSFPG